MCAQRGRELGYWWLMECSSQQSQSHSWLHNAHQDNVLFHLPPPFGRWFTSKSPLIWPPLLVVKVVENGTIAIESPPMRHFPPFNTRFCAGCHCLAVFFQQESCVHHLGKSSGSAGVVCRDFHQSKPHPLLLNTCQYKVLLHLPLFGSKFNVTIYDL